VLETDISLSATVAGGTDIFLIKLDQSGTCLWANTIKGSGTDTDIPHPLN
jgi:hypothetical protein